eukprot:CAMPEP_0178421592 /NCGR_PEP_ID=MMETSP0689_2-20121128/26725_1 /TAXON_ID=160604 /ORGANISM="Amphidinium massartii, Strain CS-259" /LENGTH=118 /DNA_ID=CAMNT_0020043105 /DNA_START=8 /DNA_END=364 /DNA_ORIENTATION=+
MSASEESEGDRSSGGETSTTLNDTAVRAVRGAQQWFGNIRGFIQEAQSAVAENVITALSGDQAQQLKQATEDEPAKQRRAEAARKDATQYFVTYKAFEWSHPNSSTAQAADASPAATS